jgi:hypothetical protein
MRRSRIPPQDVTYLVGDPPVGPNATVPVFKNLDCWHPFHTSWHGGPSNDFSVNKLGLNISMNSGGMHYMRFTAIPNDFDAGIGSDGPADSGYNCGDVDGLSDAHDGWAGHVMLVYIR